MPVPLTILASVQNKDVKYVALVPSTGKHNKYLTVQRVLMWLALFLLITTLLLFKFCDVYVL
jgi:hypothetical protein